MSIRRWYGAPDSTDAISVRESRGMYREPARPQRHGRPTHRIWVVRYGQGPMWGVVLAAALVVVASTRWGSSVALAVLGATVTTLALIALAVRPTIVVIDEEGEEIRCGRRALRFDALREVTTEDVEDSDLGFRRVILVAVDGRWSIATGNATSTEALIQTVRAAHQRAASRWAEEHG